MSNLAILILLAIAFLILFLFILKKIFSKEPFISVDDKKKSGPLPRSTRFASFYQYDSNYIDSMFYSIESRTPLVFEEEVSGGLGFPEGTAKIEGNKRLKGEIKYSPHLKISLILKVLFEKELIHYYQVKHDYVQSRQKIYDRLIEELQDFEYTASRITSEIIGRQKELIRQFDGNETVGEFLLKEIAENPDINDCFIQAYNFRIEGFDDGGNGIMRAVKRNPEDKDPDVIVKLLKDTITESGRALLRGQGDVVLSLKVFGKVSRVVTSGLPQIQIIAYVVG